jgi:hypothetical protein
MTKEEFERRMKRLADIYDRIAWMANQEERAAWVNGPAADGRYWPRKEELLNEADRILDELMKPVDAQGT